MLKTPARPGVIAADVGAGRLRRDLDRRFVSCVLFVVSVFVVVVVWSWLLAACGPSRRRPLASGFELAFKTDALWVGTSVDGVDGAAGRLAVTEAAVTRFRTGARRLAGLHARRPRRGRAAARRRRCRDRGRHGHRRRPRRRRRGQRPRGRRAGADAGRPSGRRLPRAGHGGVAELQPDAVDADGLHGEGGAVVGRKRRGAAAEALWGRETMAGMGGHRSTARPTGLDTASRCSTGRVSTSSWAPTRTAVRARCWAGRTNGFRGRATLGLVGAVPKRTRPRGPRPGPATEP